MARDHFIVPTAPERAYMTVRFGAGNTTNDQVTTAEVGKIAKLVGESRYNLAAVGDEIEAVVAAVELAACRFDARVLGMGKRGRRRGFS